MSSVSVAVDSIESAPVARTPRETPTSSTFFVRTITPDRVWEWDHYVRRHEHGSFFHLLGWRGAVREAFGHEDMYLIALRDGRIVGVLPLVLIASRLTGRRLVSVPYGVGGGILADDPVTVDALYRKAVELAGRYKCSIIDFRSEQAVIAELPVVDRYAGFIRELPESPGQVAAFLPRKARAAARNARNKFKLTVHFGDQHLDQAWALYSMGMRRIGSINYPITFFQALLEQTPDRHWVSLVYWQGRPVAGLVTFLFGKTVLPYFIGTTDDARQCSAANFVYMTLMERAVEHGYRTFDFGRSRQDNSGSYNFKRLNGFEPRPLGYQCYVPPGAHSANLSPSNPKLRIARKPGLFTELVFLSIPGPFRCVEQG